MFVHINPQNLTCHSSYFIILVKFELGSHNNVNDEAFNVSENVHDAENTFKAVSSVSCSNAVPHYDEN